MSSHEIFPNPTVKQVILQIRFPNLFYIENKIGDYQVKIIEMFPESALAFRRNIVFADIGPEGKFEALPSSPEGDQTAKVWQFKSSEGISLNVTSSSIDINSEVHKSYDQGSRKFRDVIKSAIGQFLDVMEIPTTNRIGLRYIDECPIPAKDNTTFSSYYNTAFPIERFNIDKVDEMLFRTVVQRNKHKLIYMESLQKQDNNRWSLVLDFDGFATNIQASEYLKICDELHELISKEYFATIKGPVIEFMRKGEKQDEK